jgi:hypothetical protein
MPLQGERVSLSLSRLTQMIFCPLLDLAQQLPVVDTRVSRSNHRDGPRRIQLTIRLHESTGQIPMLQGRGNETTRNTETVTTVTTVTTTAMATEMEMDTATANPPHHHRTITTIMATTPIHNNNKEITRPPRPRLVHNSSPRSLNLNWDITPMVSRLQNLKSIHTPVHHRNQSSQFIHLRLGQRRHRMIPTGIKGRKTK